MKLSTNFLSKKIVILKTYKCKLDDKEFLERDLYFGIIINKFIQSCTYIQWVKSKPYK
jgi:hypothetical protein